MPWEAADAEKHTHLADTPARRRQWAHVSNAVLQRTGDEAAAIEAANGVLKKNPSMKGDEEKPKAAPSPKSAKPAKSNLGSGMKPHPSMRPHWSGK